MDRVEEVVEAALQELVPAAALAEDDELAEAVWRLGVWLNRRWIAREHAARTSA